ncbi:MAG: hypothetical protein Harvfovirus31_8 [Harvfovirus sp.]|uniref:C2H2-type domain-containing protein n=1 Tax=Harvfovirus sp. TaxID=2487768 RepID=A0A3G5A2F8_9VIRU|nr:MAG: hypothetical protein Harvfovirus31_8 [Harvfovirus sp.]
MAKLVGFHLSADFCGIYAFYLDRCERCLDPFPMEDPYVTNLTDLAVLGKTPEEIKLLPKVEIKRLSSLLPKHQEMKLMKFNRRLECPCQKLAGPSWTLCRKISVNSFCCERKRIIKILREGSLSCPFCLRVICSWACLKDHVKRMHSDSGCRWIVDLALLGGEWCPLCGDILRRGHVESSEKELFGLIKKGEDARYQIKNTLCSRCRRWNHGKLLKLPKMLRIDEKLYRSDRYVPRNVERDTLHLGELGPIEIFDRNTGFYADLLKQDVVQEIKDSCLDPYSIDRRGGNFYRTIWDGVLYTCETGRERRLRTVEEVRAMEIPGTLILAKIRTEIALLEGALCATQIISPLRSIIRGYLPWQLWNFERVLSRIHADIIRYAPSVVALMSVIGAGRLPWIYE